MTDSSFLRSSDLARLKEILAEGACCSIVGLSNAGKSALLRAVAEPDADPNAPLNVYVDCNLMLALTDQAFYEVTLRSVLGVAKHLTVKVPAKVIAEVEKL